MKVYSDKFEDQPVDPVDTYYTIDQVKLVKWLKHMRKLNMHLMNDLGRADIQRAIDKGRFETYDCLLGDIHRGTIFMK